MWWPPITTWGRPGSAGRTTKKTSARLLREDPALERWFTPEERETMAQAVEDHRASGGREPRSIYGKIVSEADRDIDPERIVQRVMAYGRFRYPQLGEEGQVQRAVEHIREKYGEGGYLKLWLHSPRNQAGLDTLRKMARRRGAGGGVQAVWVRPYMCPTWTARCWTGRSGCRRYPAGDQPAGGEGGGL